MKDKQSVKQLEKFRTTIADLAQQLAERAPPTPALDRSIGGQIKENPGQEADSQADTGEKMVSQEGTGEDAESEIAEHCSRTAV